MHPLLAPQCMSRPHCPAASPTPRAGLLMQPCSGAQRPGADAAGARALTSPCPAALPQGVVCVECRGTLQRSRWVRTERGLCCKACVLARYQAEYSESASTEPSPYQQVRTCHRPPCPALRTRHSPESTACRPPMTAAHSFGSELTLRCHAGRAVQELQRPSSTLPGPVPLSLRRASSLAGVGHTQRSTSLPLRRHSSAGMSLRSAWLFSSFSRAEAPAATAGSSGGGALPAHLPLQRPSPRTAPPPPLRSHSERATPSPSPLQLGRQSSGVGPAPRSYSLDSCKAAPQLGRRSAGGGGPVACYDSALQAPATQLRRASSSGGGPQLSRASSSGSGLLKPPRMYMDSAAQLVAPGGLPRLGRRSSGTLIATYESELRGSSPRQLVPPVPGPAAGQPSPRPAAAPYALSRASMSSAGSWEGSGSEQPRGGSPRQQAGLDPRWGADCTCQLGTWVDSYSAKAAIFKGSRR